MHHDENESEGGDDDDVDDDKTKAARNRTVMVDAKCVCLFRTENIY